MAHRHLEPRHASFLSSLSEIEPVDSAQFYGELAARWYWAEMDWKRDDLDFYPRLAAESAGPGGSVLELAAGEGRVTLVMAGAGFRVTALDSSAHMLGIMRDRLAKQPADVQDRVEIVEQDMRAFQLDRLFRLIYLPFNTLLALAEPRDRQRALERVREHLAPSGVFAFEVFTPNPAMLMDDEDFRVEREHDIDHPDEGGTVHARRDVLATHDYARQIKRVRYRHNLSRDGVELAAWEDAYEMAYIFPRELELLLERQGFRIKRRYGSAAFTPYEPTASDMQPQFVVAQLEP